jgi:hypothetical protein
MSSNTNSNDTGSGNTDQAARNKKRREKKKHFRSGTAGRRKVSNYKGATEEMNGHVYECTTETDNRNQYTRTTEELLSYINKHIDKNKQDILSVIKNLEQPTIVEPEDPDEPIVGDNN